MMYTLKTTTNYRVATINDALRLREWLENHSKGELTSFKYTTKYNKKVGEILDEYQLVTAIITIDNEKDPEGIMPINMEEEQ